ncbi:MAG: hypothetical protein ABJK11_14335 [Balneola sp.]
MNYINKLKAVVFFVIVVSSTSLNAQNRQLSSSQQFRLGERIIRIAEPGVFVDSLNVWGDVGSAGRYLVPKGTSLAELISYSLGPRTLRDNQTEIDWSRMRVEINIQEYNKEQGGQTIEKFRYRFEDPFPQGMREFKLRNNQTVTVRVKRKPSFRDYLGVVASTVSALATSIIVIDRISRN